jgi:anti-sigma B factor antagonist
MDFLLEEVDDIKIIRIKEERLDSHLAPDLKTQLLVLNKQGGKVIIDLTKTQYIDSSGLGALLLGLRQAKEANTQFAICGAQKRVRNLINIAHLDKVLVNYENEFEAIEAMNKENSDE